MCARSFLWARLSLPNLRDSLPVGGEIQQGHVDPQRSAHRSGMSWLDDEQSCFKTPEGHQLKLCNFGVYKGTGYLGGWLQEVCGDRAEVTLDVHFQ